MINKPLTTPEQGMTYDEIGKLMGISGSSVWSIEQRALKKLARKLAHLKPSEGEKTT